MVHSACKLDENGLLILPLELVECTDPNKCSEPSSEPDKSAELA